MGICIRVEVLEYGPKTNIKESNFLVYVCRNSIHSDLIFYDDWKFLKTFKDSG